MIGLVKTTGSDKIRSISAVATVFALLFLAIFQLTGLRTFVALFAVFFLPMYLITSQLGFSTLESVVLAIFLSLGMVSSLVYYTSLLIGSFTLSIAVSFAVLMIIAVLVNLAIRKFGKKKPAKENIRIDDENKERKDHREGASDPEHQVPEQS
ncbi:hypothetical protein GF351_05755 [Candidatus Woesearchaeota archaeon]|nr:hypothetical protein [Candidatus Woesearchaeota archaeon]